METCGGKNQQRVRERMAREEQVRERVDEDGTRWFKAYCGGGRHFENWLAQCRELGEVRVEEIPADGLGCYMASGEKLYRIWVKMKQDS